MTKDRFHSYWKRELRRIAKELGLVEFDVRSNKGGDGILGEVVLHACTLYVLVGGSTCDADTAPVLYRSCTSRKDYTGGSNQWMSTATLLTPAGVDALRKAQGIL